MTYMGRDGSVQMISERAPVIDVEMCLFMKAGIKLAFDELMPETDKLKKNKIGRGNNFTAFLMMCYLQGRKGRCKNRSCQ